MRFFFGGDGPSGMWLCSNGLLVTLLHICFGCLFCFLISLKSKSCLLGFFRCFGLLYVCWVVSVFFLCGVVVRLGCLPPSLVGQSSAICFVWYYIQVEREYFSTIYMIIIYLSKKKMFNTRSRCSALSVKGCVRSLTLARDMIN